MNDQGLWYNPTFIKIAVSTLIFIFALGAVSFFLQRNNSKWMGAWASVKSWILAAPFLFAAVGAPAPWPFLLLVMAAIYGSKTFFRMTGMYHRSWFVWASYFGIFGQAYLVYTFNERFFNIMPMAFFCAIALIPVMRNSATHMIQYVAMSLMNFIFFGWGVLHLARIIMWENGILIALHVAILSEFSSGMLHLGSRMFGRHRPFSNITSRFSVEGYIFSALLTVFLAFAMRGLLPHREEPFWLTTGLAVVVLGRLGALTMSFIRRDLGIKDSGVFIIGRDDLLSRLEGLIFAAPAVYYGLSYLTGKI